MFHRISPYRRAVARLLIWTTTIATLWSAAPMQARSAAPRAVTRTAPARVVPGDGRMSYGMQGGGATAAIPFFGPTRFTRTTGAPNVFTRTITVPAWLVGPYTFHIQNGETTGANRVASARIEVNGQTIAVPSDFNQTVAGLDRTVSLTPISTLRVTLASSPGSFLILRIGGANGDHTAPRGAVVAPAPASVVGTASPQLSVSYTDAIGPGEAGASGVDIATLAITLDGQDRTALFTKGPAQATAELAGVLQLAEGEHTLALSVRDAAGNTGTASAQFRIDNSAPAVRIVTPSPGAYLRVTTLNVTGTVDDGTSVAVTVNGVAATVTGDTFAVTLPVSDGVVDLHAAARDAAGNESSADAQVFIDTKAPSLVLTAPTAGLVSNTAVVHVEGTVADASPVIVLVNGAAAPVTTGAFRADTTLPADGSQNIEVVAEDRAGNRSTASTSIVVDLTAPSIQISAPLVDSFVATGSPAVQIDWSDGVGIAPESLVVLADGQDVTSRFSASPGGATGTLDALSDAPHRIEATVNDRGGNQGTAATSFTVDTIAPQITIAQPMNHEFTSAESIGVSGTVLDASTVAVTVNGVATPVIEGAFTLADVAVGGGPTQPVAVVAIDAAGNRQDAAIVLNVDRAAPALQITGPSPNAFLKGPLAEVTGSVSDASPIAALDVNGVAATVTGGTFVAQIPVTDGTFPITATARDAANNLATAAVSVNVDSAPPVIAVWSPAEGDPTNNEALTISGSVSDSSPVTLRIDTSAGSVAVSLTEGAFTHSVQLGPEGANTIAIIATDAAGNQATFDRHVIRDLTPPTLDIAGPAEDSVIGVEPITMTGFVYDLTATTVRVNGADASRVQDSWSGPVSFGAEGPQTVSIVATDAAGNQSTATRRLLLDLNPPVVTIDQPSNASLTASETVTVSGHVADVSLASLTIAGQPVPVSAGAATTPFSANVALADGDNHLHVVATDRLGRTSEAEVVLTRDSIAPSLQLAAPATISRRRGAQATVSASDNLALADVVVSANGSPLGTFGAAPFTLDLTVPDAVAVGGQLLVTATATDRAGNSTTATHALRVTADGVVVGRAIDDGTGLPLGEATVRMNDGTAETDARGEYSLPASDLSVVVRVEKAGMTSVERVVPVQSGVGTAIVDARLTLLAEPRSIAPGATISAAEDPRIPNPISLTIPEGGASVRLTPLSPQGLPALLPLGWSPIAAFDVRSAAPIADLVATATLSATVPASADAQLLLPAFVHLVEYRSSLHAWVIAARNVPVANGEAVVTIAGLDPDRATAFALVVPDDADPPMAVAAVNEPLTGVAVALLPATATSAGAVTPSILPPAGGTALGVLGIQSPTPLPSGTIVQTDITETFTLASGDTASEETRSQDIVLYRSPAASPALVQGFTPALSAVFPITPSRTFGTTQLAEGRVHLDILAGREAARGQTGGSEPLALTAGNVTLMVPAHALPDDTAIRVQPAVASSFLPTAVDLEVLAEIVVDLSGSSLDLAAELSIPLPAAVPGALSRFLLGRVERLDGIPHVVIVGLAAASGDRLVSRTASGLPGVTIGGRYVFYRTSSAFGFVGVTTSAAGTPVSAIVSADRWPFIARGDGSGRATLVAPEAPAQVDARVPGTALAGSATGVVVADQLTAIALSLGGTATLATVTPADGAIGFAPTAQIEIATTAPIAAASVESAMIRLTKGDTHVAIRLVLAGSGRTLAVVPQTRLEAGVRYQLDAAGLVDVFGGAIAVPPTGFTTASDAAPTFDPDALVVSFPDEDGIVHVTAPAGSLQPGTGVLIINAGSGEVVSFMALNDGSLQGELSATIDHRLIVTITDPQGKATTFQRSKYVAPDGTTGIGAGGGTVEGEGGIEMRVPEGALDEGVVLKIEPFDADFMEERPALPGAKFGAGIKIGSTTDAHFKKEVDLAFPIPAGVPANPKDAFYYVYRRIDGPNGQVFFETVDYATVEGTGTDARIVTASYPFTGYKDMWNRWDVTNGTDLGVSGFGAIAGMGTAIAMVFWTHNALLPGAPVGGVISGRVLRPRFEPGSTTPVYDGVPGVLVRRDDTQDPSATVAFTQPDGRFTIFDPHFTTGAVQLRAETGEGIFTATTYAVAGLDSKLVSDDALIALMGKGTFKNVATANITLPPAQPMPPAPQITIRLFTETGGVRREITGLVLAGTPLVVGFTAQDGTVAGATINGEELSVHEDPRRGQASANGMDAILDQVFTPHQPGSYTITATALPPFGSPVNASTTIRVIAAGGGTHTSVPGRPGVLRVSPLRDARGVPVSAFVDLAFTEPVTGVTAASVRIEDAGGQAIPVQLSGVGIEDGQPVAVDKVGAGHVVTSLTLIPQIGLKFNTVYRVILTSAIADRDTDAAGAPAPQPLVEFTSPFTTFGPEALGGSADTPRATGLVVLGDRAYIAETLHTGGTGGATQFGHLRVYDVANAALPTEIPPETWINYPPRDIAGEATDEGQTKTVVVATAPRTWFFLQGELIYYYEIRSTASNLFVYDVSTEPAKWVGAVSLTDNLLDGIPNRIVMKDGMVYAATMNKGIQVVDVQTAKNGFAQTGVPQDYVSYKKVYDGGVNKDAIVNTIPITDPPDAAPGTQQYHLPLVDLKVDDFVVGGFSRRLVLATGPRKQTGLVIVDPVTGETIWRGALTIGDRSVEWANAIALANVDGHPLALIGGYGGGTNLLAVVDLSPLAGNALAAPAVLTFVELSHSVGDILVDGNTAIVSGGQGAVGPDGQPGVATLVDLTIPGAARVVGTLTGVGSRLALAGNLLFSTERSFLKGAPTPLGGVRTAALGTTAIIRRVTPSAITTENDVDVSESDVRIEFNVVPSSYQMNSGTVQIFRDGTVVDTLVASVSGSTGSAVWPAKRVINRDAAYTAALVIDAESDRPLQAGPAPVPLVDLVLVDKRGDETFAPPASDPRPTITLDPISPAAIRLQGDSDQADIRLTGIVKDAVADIVAGGAADIKEVMVNDRVYAVTRVDVTPTPARPFAYQGRFELTAPISISGGETVITVSATNIAGGVGYDSVTIRAQQDEAVPVVADEGTAPLFRLEPLTLVTAPLDAAVADSVVIYHGDDAPTGSEPTLAETGPATGQFTGITADLGSVTVSIPAPYASNDPDRRDTVQATVSASGLEMANEVMEFLETSETSGVFRSPALTLPSNARLRLRLPRLPAAAAVDTITARYAAADRDGELPESAADTSLFAGDVPGLGTVAVTIVSFGTGAGQRRVMRALLASTELDVTDYYVELLETAAGSLVFETDVRGVTMSYPTTATGTRVLSVADNLGSDPGTFEPVWVVAEGLRTAGATDRGLLDGDEFELTTDPVPAEPPAAGVTQITASAAPVRGVRFKQPVLFVEKGASVPVRNVRAAVQQPAPADRAARRVRGYALGLTFDDRRLVALRPVSALVLSKHVVIPGTDSMLTASWVTDRPRQFHLSSITIPGGGVTVTPQAVQDEADGPKRWRVTTTLKVNTAASAALGRRDAEVRFSGGDRKRITSALNVMHRRMVVFAIDGLAKYQFDAAITQTGVPVLAKEPLSAMKYIFSSTQAKGQSIERAESTTFAPITYTRWASVFSGATPSQTLVPSNNYLNRRELVDGIQGTFGDVDQGLNWNDVFRVRQVYNGAGSYNRHFQVPLVYDTLNGAGLKSIVILQQAGVGKQTASPGSDRFWKGDWAFNREYSRASLPFFADGFKQSVALDNAAVRGAREELRLSYGEFDLMVVYLAGLDHYIHDRGAPMSTSSEYFRTVLHGSINAVVEQLDHLGVLESTAFAVFADHGHYDTAMTKAVDFTSRGSEVTLANGRRAPQLRTVLQNAAPNAVATADWDGSFNGSLIFQAQFGMAHVYVAGGPASLYTQRTDWVKPPSVEKLDPYVKALFKTYVAGRGWEGKGWQNQPVADILVRVPAQADSFDGSTYWAVRRDFNPANPLADQLMPVGDLAALGIGDAPYGAWQYNDPADRVRDWTSPNTGDIILLANARHGYQFGAPYRGQHGSLTYADSIVPVAFGFPGASGNSSEDTLLAPIRNFLGGFAEETPENLFNQKIVRALLEANAVRAFFGLGGS
jgi:hypothetical protein